MVSNGGPAEGGYFVQAKDADDGWKKISGMTKAIQIQLLKADNNVIVNCGFGNWSDKVGAGVIGWFLFAPLAVTAIVGSVKQNKLPDEVFMEIERFIMMGGNSIVASVGSRIEDNEVVCPNCKTRNPKGQNFCKQCGATIADQDTKFCPQCGSPVDTAPVCGSCGAPLSEDTLFCPKCGAKRE